MIGPDFAVSPPIRCRSCATCPCRSFQMTLAWRFDQSDRLVDVVVSGFALAIDTLLISLASIVFCLYLFERRDRERNRSRALLFVRMNKRPRMA